MRDKSALNTALNSEESLLESYIQEISSAKPLSDEEEARLAGLIKQGDTKAKDKLVKANLKFVVSIARQYATASVSILDLVNEGNIALIKAADNYNPSYGKRFSSYSAGHIRRAIEAFLPQQDQRFEREKFDNISEQAISADKSAIKASDDEKLATLVALLPEREQNVMKAYYGIACDQMTLAEIGMKYGFTRERARQIRDTATRHINKLKHNKAY